MYDRGRKCVVLNTTYEPLSIVSARRGLVIVLKGRATIVKEHANKSTVNTINTNYPVPAQIILKEYVKTRNPVNQPAQLTQNNLFLRDNYTCAYCGRTKSQLKNSEKLTRDHIISKKKGGKDIWLNCITACSSCNHKKADHYMQEIGMSLLFQPFVPTVFDVWSKKMLI